MKKLLLCLACLFLTACQTLHPQQNLAWPERKAQLSSIKQWDAQGSIAAKTTKNGWNANFSWHQQNDDYLLQLFGPLGINRIQLTGSPGQVMLKAANNQTATANTPEALLKQQLGWYLPVSNLYYWLRGLPSPARHAQQSFDANKHLAQLDQDGWHLDFLRYQSVNGMDLPARIVLTNPNWQVRIAINQWQTN